MTPRVDLFVNNLAFLRYIMGKTFADMILDLSQKLIQNTDCAMLDNTVLVQSPFLIEPKILVKKKGQDQPFCSFLFSSFEKKNSLFLNVRLHKYVNLSLLFSSKISIEIHYV